MQYDNRFNTKIKVYPDGNFKATYSNKNIFLPPELKEKKPKTKQKGLKNKESRSWETELKHEQSLEYSNKPNDDIEELTDQQINDSIERAELNMERSIRRAKERVFDIAYLNEFKYFVTVTFDPKKVNSTNVIEVMHKMRIWLSNCKQRFGMEYVLVPEYHEKGGIHCHLLITDYPSRFLAHAQAHKKGGGLKFNRDGTPKMLYASKHQPIYNMLNWKYGHSTCIPVYKTESNNSNVRLASYITKYMTKDIYKIFGKFYWSSKGLERETDLEFAMSDYDSLPLKEYEIKNTDIKLKYDSRYDYSIGGNTHEKKP